MSAASRRAPRAPAGRELRALRRLEREAAFKSPAVFVSERGAPLSPAGLDIALGRLSHRLVQTARPKMSGENLNDEIERLRKENEALKKGASAVA
jgi:hypothetical protein